MNKKETKIYKLPEEELQLLMFQIRHNQRTILDKLVKLTDRLDKLEKHLYD